MKKKAPEGVKFIRYVYLANALFYVLSLIMFYNRIMIWGVVADFWASWLIRMIFISIPVYLFFRMRKLNRDSWFTAVYFESFFILNNITAILESYGFMPAMIRISGIYNSVVYSVSAIIIFVSNIALNILILGYLFGIKKWFFRPSTVVFD